MKRILEKLVDRLLGLNQISTSFNEIDPVQFEKEMIEQLCSRNDV